jgi:hypothetical protein
VTPSFPVGIHRSTPDLKGLTEKTAIKSGSDLDNALEEIMNSIGGIH